MKKTTVASLFISLILAGSMVTARQAGAPRFQDYSVPVYKGRVAPVNLSSAKGARMFRTNLREGARKGVNFAGRYALVAWGCGTGCMDVGIVDEKTGAVYFPAELAGLGVWYFEGSGYEEPLTFKPDSRLLVLSGFPSSEGNKDNPKSGLYYYEWTGTRLRLLKFIPKKREEGR